MADILHELVIHASPEDVYQALTEEEGLANWWTRDTRAVPMVGAVAEFGFHDRSVVFKMRIDQLVPGRKVSWYCLGEHPEWKETVLEFGLSPDSDRTRLRFSHRGWKSINGIFARCSFDWARYLLSLKSYLETGEGNPHAG